jgi:hypothetical protein
MLIVAYATISIEVVLGKRSETLEARVFFCWPFVFFCGML